MNRDRVCAALIIDNTILMVRIDEQDRSFWTLPGGGVEKGETYEQAVAREMVEETNIRVRVIRQLFEMRYSQGIDRCFLVEQIHNEEKASLGYDPELNRNNQVLKGIDWRPINELKEDLQVRIVLEAISSNRIVKA